MNYKYSQHGVKGVDKKYNVETHSFDTEDGVTLLMTRITRDKPGNIVFLSHGLPASSQIFMMPGQKNLVNFLLENDTSEVWSLDHRGSSRYVYNQLPKKYTLDDIACFDVPAAFKKIEEVSSYRPSQIHCIVYCLGSTSFFISLLSGLIEPVKSVVACQGGPVFSVPQWARIKMNLGLPLFEKLGVARLNPRWEEDDFLISKFFAKVVKWSHFETDASLAMLTFMFGSGHPAMCEMKNLSADTKNRLVDFFGPLPLSFFRHVQKILNYGFLVPADSTIKEDHYPNLPINFRKQIKNCRVPILFQTSDKNRILFNSNVVAYQIFESERPGLQELAVISDYGHIDVLIGEDAFQDVFPTFVDFIKKHDLKKSSHETLVPFKEPVENTNGYDL